MDSKHNEEAKHESLAPKAYHLYLESTAQAKLDELMNDYHSKGKK